MGVSYERGTPVLPILIWGEAAGGVVHQGSLAGHAQVAMLASRYKPANFGAGKSPGSPSW